VLARFSQGLTDDMSSSKHVANWHVIVGLLFAAAACSSEPNDQRSSNADRSGAKHAPGASVAGASDVGGIAGASSAGAGGTSSTDAGSAGARSATAMSDAAVAGGANGAMDGGAGGAATGTRAAQPDAGGAAARDAALGRRFDAGSSGSGGAMTAVEGVGAGGISVVGAGGTSAAGAGGTSAAGAGGTSAAGAGGTSAVGAGGTSAAGAAGAAVVVRHKRVFITRDRWDGNLRLAALSFSIVTSTGLAAGDALCNWAALDAALGGAWVAWLSDGTQNAIDRIQDVGPWYRMDGAEIFHDKASLSGDPLAPIDVDETGHVLGALKDPDGIVHIPWTGTHANGSRAQDTCHDWLDNASDAVGVVGSQDAATDDKWSELSSAPCNRPYHLYCFEQ
jgi:hypothetical protein